MPEFLPSRLIGLRIHLVGAKGTGVCALAELLVAAGAIVSGSDVDETFYTDEVLAAIGVPVYPFSSDTIVPGIDLIIHSAAYRPDTHPELVRAKDLGIAILTYPEALGSLSSSRDSSAVAGVHGKTTTTALAGVAARALGLPASILVGSAVGAFGGRSTLSLGDELLIAETCEYRRHFLAFHPRRIVITSVEPDHQDYYPDYEAIALAFVEYLCSLPLEGTVIYCADDPGAIDVWMRAKSKRPDLLGIPYGFKADGAFGMRNYEVAGERGTFTLQGFDACWNLRVPGRHVALDAVAALALCHAIVHDRSGRSFNKEELDALVIAIEGFSGSRRRSEIVGEAGGVLFIDDYAHHPTAIQATISGLKEFYPDRRLVVDFMSHTCSRTRALLSDFASSFAHADITILHKIYPSAREAPDLEMNGRLLYERTLATGTVAVYFEEPMEALPFLVETLREGDIFVTMGAGDNWKLGKAAYAQRAGFSGTEGHT